MRVLLSLLLLVSAIIVFSQRDIPNPTSADDRYEGYQQRLKLQNASWVSNVPFRNVGPTIMSGRVVDLAVDPDDPSHFYVAYASGSLWETFNHGTSFQPLFDGQIVMTIGDIAVDWTNDIIYVGTGENNASRSSYSGYGVFKSADNGETWQHLGLPETHHIGRIRIHPADPNTLWVAALGHLYSENEERGIYKSTDGGNTWEKTLYVNERTGIVELVMHPQNPEVLLAAAWEKDRKAWNFTEAGPGTAIFRSEDGGDTWTEIADDSGFPDTRGTGRIGLAFAPSEPNTVYAILDNQDRRAKDEEEEEKVVTKDKLREMSASEFLSLENKDINTFLDEQNFPKKYNAVDIKKDVEKGKVAPIDLVKYVEDANSLLFDTPVKGGEMYRSEDAGKTWTKTHEDYIEDMIFSYGYYFGQVRVDPQNPETVYTMGVPIVKSADGGKTFESINEENVHVDHHAMWINPEDPDHIILGNDGGINISFDQGETWIKCNSPSVGQFYSIAVDMDKPYNVYGGLQDNGTWKGPSTYKYSREWYQEGKYPYQRLMGGDGMQVAVDTRDNNTVYVGYQFGNYFRVNAQSGDRKYITPSHELGDEPFRWNWEAPITLSSHNQDIVYFGSNRFHRSMNKGDDFETLSGDLTQGGKKGDVSYGTLTSISESPLRFGLIYVGSDDGLVHVTKDLGASWQNVSAGLPENYWVSQVYASHHKEGRVYVSLNGYRWDHFEPLVYVSEDYGAHWQKISANLPTEPVNVVKEDPNHENILYVGTDHGVYISLDRGKTYHAFSEGLVNAPVHDLVIHTREKDLVLGTHGRGIYIGDVQYVQQLTDKIIDKDLHLFAMDEVTFSENWGSKPWEWGDVNVPELDVIYFAGKEGSATIDLLYKDQVVVSKKDTTDQGLNYFDMPLQTDGDFKKLLSKQQQKTYEAAKDGQYYLVPGEYTLRVRLNGSSQQVPFTIKEPKKPEPRKE